MNDPYFCLCRGRTWKNGDAVSETFCLMLQCQAPRPSQGVSFSTGICAMLQEFPISARTGDSGCHKFWFNIKQLSLVHTVTICTAAHMLTTAVIETEAGWSMLFTL